MQVCHLARTGISPESSLSPSIACSWFNQNSAVVLYIRPNLVDGTVQHTKFEQETQGRERVWQVAGLGFTVCQK